MFLERMKNINWKSIEKYSVLLRSWQLKEPERQQ